jgi:hypothetical protein
MKHQTLQRCRLAVLLLLCPIFLKAQDNGSIDTDRPDQTESAFLVPKHYFQTEWGFYFEQLSDAETHWQYPAALWKYGLSDRFELRLITEIDRFKAGGSFVSGLSPVAVGFKTKLWEQQNWLPTTSLIAHVKFPKLASKGLTGRYVAPEFRFTCNNNITKRFGVGYNFGMEWDTETTGATYIYTIAPAFSIHSKWSVYVESYGFIHPKGIPETLWDAGIKFYPTPNWMIDLSGGTGINEAAADYFIGLGVSYRWKAKK